MHSRGRGSSSHSDSPTHTDRGARLCSRPEQGRGSAHLGREGPVGRGRRGQQAQSCRRGRGKWEEAAGREQAKTQPVEKKTNPKKQKETPHKCFQPQFSLRTAI